MSELWPISRRGDHRPCITRWLAVAICVSLAIGMLSACSSGSSSTGGTGTPSSPKNTSASGSYQTEATMTDAYSDDYIMMQIPSTWEGGTVEASPRGRTSGVFQTDFCLDGDGNYLVFSVSGMEGDSSSLSCITTWGGLAASTVWEMNNGDQTGLTPKQYR